MANAIDMDALVERVKARREARGLNVRFINERGEFDEYSFRDETRASRFRDNLARHGMEILND